MNLRSKLLWVALLIGLLAFWAYTCAYGQTPPLPPVKKAPRKAVTITQGSGAAALLVKPLAVVPLVDKLVWDWTPNASNTWSQIRFLVRSNNNARVKLSSWKVVAVVATNSWPLTVNKARPMGLFSVQASNTVTHWVSE